MDLNNIKEYVQEEDGMGLHNIETTLTIDHNNIEVIACKHEQNHLEPIMIEGGIDTDKQHLVNYNGIVDKEQNPINYNNGKENLNDDKQIGYANVLNSKTTNENINIYKEECLINNEKSVDSFHIKEDPDRFLEVVLEESQNKDNNVNENNLPVIHCLDCKYQCFNKLEMKNHIKTIHNTSSKRIVFKCRECKSTFPKKRALVNHIVNIHYTENSYRCKTCNFFFLDKKVLAEHIFDEHLEAKKYKCVECNCEYSKKKFLVRHLKTVHNVQVTDNSKKKVIKKQELLKKVQVPIPLSSPIKRINRCNLCKFSCKTKSALSKHKNTHRKDKPFVCDECDFKAKSPNTLRRHFEVVHLQIKPYECEECPQKFSQYSALNFHIDSVHRKLKPFFCEECPFSCASTFRLKSHIKAIHEGVRPYECPECDSNFTRKTHLDRHIKGVHVEKMEKIIKCEDCDHEAKNQYNMDRHIKAVHKKIPKGFKPRTKYKSKQEFKCIECDFKCDYPEPLIEHSKDVHNILKPFKCNQCELAFAFKSYLDSHRRGVHAEKKYECTICPFKSTKKFFLNAHINHVHLKLRPFDCEECDQKFSSKYDLKNHTNVVHRKIKPFQCPYCYFNFGLKTYLNRHIKVVHEKQKPHECPWCSYKSAGKYNLDKHKKALHKDLVEIAEAQENIPSGIQATLQIEPRREIDKVLPINFSKNINHKPPQKKHQRKEKVHPVPLNIIREEIQSPQIDHQRMQDCVPPINFNREEIQSPTHVHPERGIERHFSTNFNEERIQSPVEKVERVFHRNFSGGVLRPPPQMAHQGNAERNFSVPVMNISSEPIRSSHQGVSNRAFPGMNFSPGGIRPVYQDERHGVTDTAFPGMNPNSSTETRHHSLAEREHQRGAERLFPANGMQSPHQEETERIFPVNFSRSIIRPPPQLAHQGNAERNFSGMNFSTSGSQQIPQGERQGDSEKSFPSNINTGGIGHSSQPGAFDRFLWGAFGVGSDVSRSLWGGF